MDLNGKIKTKIYWQTLIDTIEWKIHGGGGGARGGKLVKISIFKNSSRRSRQTTCISLISCRIKIRADRALYYVSSQPKVINIYVRLILYRTTKTASVRINLGVITFCPRSKRTLATWPSDEYVTLWIVWLATNPSPRQIFIAIWLPPSLFLSPPFVPRLPKIDETPVNIVEIVI